MALLLRILGYGWLVLGAILILLVYFVLFSERWPVIEDVIGAALILLPGFAAIGLAAAVDRRNARRIGRGYRARPARIGWEMMGKGLARKLLAALRRMPDATPAEALAELRRLVAAERAKG